jgi:hypothetical protein
LYATAPTQIVLLITPPRFLVSRVSQKTIRFAGVYAFSGLV